MRAKVPTKRRDGRSSFKSLAKYVDSERDHIDRETGEVKQRKVSIETNCLFRETAWREMKAVADMNGRVKDPVYHFTVSWPARENPTDRQVFEAGRAGIEAVGMDGHQYLAVVHRDTDNVHGHYMVNRVNPETYKAVYPDRDFYKLDKCMREVEVDQGWSHDTGTYAVHERDGKKAIDWAEETPAHRQPDQEKLPGRARQMEAMTGNESLTSYAQGQAKKDALEALKHGGGWRELHEALGRHGLEIKPKGQGLAIYSKSNPEQTPIKASTMAQELGGGKLTKRLGPYQEPVQEIQHETPQHEYSDQRPKRDPAMREKRRNERAIEREELRDKYKELVDQWKAEKVPARKAMYESQKERQKDITEKHKKEREDIRNCVGSSSSVKRAVYSVLAFDTAAKRQELNEAIKKEREAFRQERPKSYRDWVADLAEKGDLAAMRQVRGWAYADKRRAKELQRTEEESKRGPHIGAENKHSEQEHEPAKPRRITERVTWNVDRNTGTVDYKLDGRSTFRDEGRRLSFTEHGARDRDGIEAGLLLASEKWCGQALEVHGHDEFKKQVVQLAIEHQLFIKFADKDLEQRRVEGLQKQKELATTKAKTPFMVSKAPNIKESRYTGDVHAVDQYFVYQQHGKDIIRHARKVFDEVPEIGEKVQVRYWQGEATVKNLARERERDIDGPSM